MSADPLGDSALEETLFPDTISGPKKCHVDTYQGAFVPMYTSTQP